MNFTQEDHYKQGIQAFSKVMPDVVDKYNAFTGVCFADGVIKKKEKELIALGISLSHRDDNCVKYHIEEALHKGASEQEIWETVNVAIAMSGGMTISQSIHWVSEAIRSHQIKQ